MGVEFIGTKVDTILYKAYHDCDAKGLLVPDSGGMDFTGPVITYPYVCSACNEKVVLTESMPALRYVEAGSDLEKVEPFKQSQLPTYRD